jgi:hypothetical protein
MDPGELLDLVVEVLDRLDIPHFVTGSTATIAYGEPRFTNDIDIVLRLERNDIAHFVAEFASDDFYLALESIELALQRAGSFNLIHPSSGLKVDFMVSANTEFNRSRFERTRLIETGSGRSVAFASPEDVILKKLEYFRNGGSEKHLRDIVGVLRTSEELELVYVEDWARRLGVEAEWQQVRELAR